ncbi:MAG: hypothetical protein ACLRL6_08665 [Clostridium sp.]
MKQSLEIIQNQKQKFSSKLVPSMEILALSQHELESLVDASLMDNPFSDVDQNTISLKTRDVDLDFKRVRKSRVSFRRLHMRMKVRMICLSMSSCSSIRICRQKR